MTPLTQRWLSAMHGVSTTRPGTWKVFPFVLSLCCLVWNCKLTSCFYVTNITFMKDQFSIQTYTYRTLNIMWMRVVPVFGWIFRHDDKGKINSFRYPTSQSINNFSVSWTDSLQFAVPPAIFFYKYKSKNLKSHQYMDEWKSKNLQHISNWLNYLELSARLSIQFEVLFDFNSCMTHIFIIVKIYSVNIVFLRQGNGGFVCRCDP
jgi:hypothetical protein